MTTPIALAAFDMAGTTVDEHGDVYRALRGCVEETGVPVAADDLQTWMGADKVEAIGALLRAGRAAAVEGTGTSAEPTPSEVDACFDRFRSLLAESYRANPPVSLPGVEEAIGGLRAAGIAVALTTGFSREVAGSVLEALGWTVGPSGALPPTRTGDPARTAPLDPAHTVDALVCADEVAAGRPFPYMIHRAMERTGVADVRSVLVAGDTVLDVEAGLASGAQHVIGVLTGELGREDLSGAGATAVLDSVAEVPALLRGAR